MAAPRASAHQVRQQIAASVQPAPLGGCSKHTPRCADARDYGSELRECCKALMREVVLHTSIVLNEMRLTWWVDYGALLGAVRNPLTTWADYPWLPQDGRATAGPAPGVVPHDKDADFGVLFGNSGEANVMLDRVRGKMDRKFGHYAFVRGGGRMLKVRCSYTNHTNADFFAWIAKPDGMLTRIKYINSDKYKGRDFHRDMLFPLSTVEWEGMRLPAPNNPAAFCEFRYGENWMKPVRANNDGVRRGVGHFP